MSTRLSVICRAGSLASAHESRDDESAARGTNWEADVRPQHRESAPRRHRRTIAGLALADAIISGSGSRGRIADTVFTDLAWVHSANGCRHHTLVKATPLVFTGPAI